MEQIWLQRYSPGVPAEIDINSLGAIASYFEESVAQYADRKAFISGPTGVALPSTWSTGSRT